MNRQEAWQIVEQHVRQVGLRRHMVAVEAAMRLYAEKLGEDPQLWALAGLLHDYDWEVHPTLESLVERGCPEPVVHAILAHNEEATGVARETALDYALLACDEVTGLLIACALVRPTRDIRDVPLKSVQKRWKERIFAAGVDRDHVAAATADFSRACFGGSLELWDHVAHVLAAMQGAAAALELDGRLAPPA
jgi:predicted hydrolase (HD superfamily)